MRSLPVCLPSPSRKQAISEPEPAGEPAPTEPALSARPYEALGSGRWTATNALAAATFARSEPDQPVSELEPAEESAPAEQSWSAPADEARSLQPPASRGLPAADAAPEAAAAKQPAQVGQPRRPRSRHPRSSPGWPPPREAPGARARVMGDRCGGRPSRARGRSTRARAEPAPAAESTPAAAPPWYDPGDEALEAARSAATPAFTQPEEPEPATAPEPTHEGSASAPPGKIVVSGHPPSETPEPPPSQMARRTTQAVLTGVWKRLQKPPEPPR